MPIATSCPTGPYRCTNLVVKITTPTGEVIVGVVEGLDIDLSFAGGPEPHYGSRIKKHSAGSKGASFTITRWFYTDEGLEDLLLDLFDGEIEFDLEGSLETNAGVAIPNTSIKLICCRIYRWRPRTGGADDIIGEEASGSALDWEITVLPTCCCEDGEAMLAGDFEVDADFLLYWVTSGAANRNNTEKRDSWSCQFTDNIVDQIYQDLRCYGLTDEWALDTDYITAFTLYVFLTAGMTTGDLKVKLYYTDHTDEIITFDVTGAVNAWVQYNVLPHLDAGKCLWRLEMWFENMDGAKIAYVDDVTITMAGC